MVRPHTIFFWRDAMKIHICTRSYRYARCIDDLGQDVPGLFPKRRCTKFDRKLVARMQNLFYAPQLILGDDPPGATPA